MDSLFVLALPRSLSTLVYTAAACALGLRCPSWTTDGEILNVERFAHSMGPRRDEGEKFTTRQARPDLFGRLLEFLDDVVHPRDYAYKDVVQPFVAAEWCTRARPAVLTIRRGVAEVAFSMLRQGWYYPMAAASASASGGPSPGASVCTVDEELLLLEGLVRADRALASVPGVWVQFDDLIRREDALLEALDRLYPRRRLADVRYIGEAFQRERARQRAVRDSDDFRRIESKLAIAVALVEQRDHRRARAPGPRSAPPAGAWI